jgi:multidrug efflux pump subunit AcrB
MGGMGRTEANLATQNIYLKPPEERDRSQAEIHKQIMEDMNAFTGVRAIATQPPTIGDRRSGQPLSYVLQAPRPRPADRRSCRSSSNRQARARCSARSTPTSR